MKKILHLQDIINLEYFFHQDTGKSPSLLHARDREIALSCGEQQDNPQLQISSWLNHRIEAEFGRNRRSPGDIFADIFRVFTIAALIKGLLLGGIAGLTFFSYTGATPVNVFQFLLLFILPQLLLIAFFFATKITQKLLPAIRIPTFYNLLFERGIRMLLNRLYLHWQQDIQTEQKNSIAHAFGIVKMQSNRYGRLFYWPIFSLFQKFGFAFNLALLAVTLLKITTSDLAFGWQSTIQFTDTAIHQAVQLLALPWSWLLGEAGTPGLSQIAGSRIILKDGIYHLATTDLTSWWPFLVMCLLVYGVAIRALFIVIGWWFALQQKKSISFNTPQCQALLRRMKSPIVSTQAQSEPAPHPFQAEVPRRAASPAISSQKAHPKETTHTLLAPQTVLIGIDIYEQLKNPEQELNSILEALGFTPQTILSFQHSYEEDQQLLNTLQQQREQGVLILVEGWMVPLVSLLSYIKEIRQQMTAETSISIALIGRPQSPRLLTPVAESDLQIWQQKVATLADPYIHLFPLTGIQA